MDYNVLGQASNFAINDRIEEVRRLYRDQYMNMLRSRDEMTIVIVVSVTICFLLLSVCEMWY